MFPFKLITSRAGRLNRPRNDFRFSKNSSSWPRSRCHANFERTGCRRHQFSSYKNLLDFNSVFFSEFSFFWPLQFVKSASLKIQKISKSQKIRPTYFANFRQEKDKQLGKNDGSKAVTKVHCVLEFGGRMQNLLVECNLLSYC